MSRKPHVHLKCPANVHTGDNQRIVEFGWTNSQGELCGGLFALHGYEDRLIVEVYRVDTGVEVRNETVLGNVLKRILSVLPRKCVACGHDGDHASDCAVSAAYLLLAAHEERKSP